MNLIVKRILTNSKLPHVRQCLEIQKKSQSLREKFNSLYSSAQNAIDAKQELSGEFITNADDGSFDRYLDVFSRAAAAVEIRAKLSVFEAIAIGQIEKDPGSVEAIESALREVMAELQKTADGFEANEKKFASESGLEYSGKSPALKSLDDTIADYNAAIVDVAMNGDQDGHNVFSRHSALIKA